MYRIKYVIEFQKKFCFLIGEGKNEESAHQNALEKAADHFCCEVHDLVSTVVYT